MKMIPHPRICRLDKIRVIVKRSFVLRGVILEGAFQYRIAITSEIGAVIIERNHKKNNSIG
jgi:hypothetical protein